MSQSKIVAAVELGTTTFKVLVGEMVDSLNLNVLGRASAPSQGIKKGELFSSQRARNVLARLVEDAENDSQVKVDTVYLAQTGAHLQSRTLRGSAMVSSADGRVSASDMERARQEAYRVELPGDRVGIHYIKNPFRLDGREVKDPLEMSGRMLEASYLHMHGDRQVIGNQIHLINSIGFDVADMVLSSVASAYVLLADSEKEAGAMVIDIGGGTTDYAVYRDGAIIKAGVIPVGGDHITNDLSLGLRINRKNAEKLKTQFAKALIDQSDKHEKVWVRGDMNIGDRTVLRHAIYRIVHPRVEEIFAIIRSQCQDLLHSESIRSGVFLTGGTSRLPGIDEACRRVMDLPVKVGNPVGWVRSDLSSGEWSTALGVLYFALFHEGDQPSLPSSKGLLRKVANLLTLKRSNP